MKTTTLALIALLTVLNGHAQIPNSSPAPTNAPQLSTNITTTADAAATALANAVGALRANVNDLRTQNDTLSKRMDHIETGFLVIVVLFVVAVAAMCFLNAKNRPVINRYASKPDQSTLPGR